MDTALPLEKAEQAIFAGGCFWGVEALFKKTKGVLETEVGYTGGHVPHPDYKAVCSYTTGHAEAVHIWFDPEQISYKELVRIFFENHDPTTPNRQGPDIGSQYRSMIYTFSDEQKAIAERSIAEIEESLRKDIVTKIEPASTFYRAEEYHQDYLTKKEGVCH